MKKYIDFTIWLSLFACIFNTAGAQHTISIDIAGVKNMRNTNNGVNVSSFYHFNKHIVGGIEINRFFPVTKNIHEEMVHQSAWDADLNFHYLLPLNPNLSVYPITGISHTSEKEESIQAAGEVLIARFWSYNSGVGFLLHKGKWTPHLEYLYTWGHLNQQFLLAGFSYEIEFKHKHHYNTGNKK